MGKKNKKDVKSRRFNFTKITTIIGVFVSVCAILMGLYTYRDSVKRDAYSKAVSVYNDYLLTSIEYSDMIQGCDTSNNVSIDENSLRYASFAFKIAETLFILVGNDTTWRVTISEILCQNRKCIEAANIEVCSVEKSFLAYITKDSTNYYQGCMGTLFGDCLNNK